jgi:hypothetical protein
MGSKKAAAVRIMDLVRPEMDSGVLEYMRNAPRETPIDWSVDGVLSKACQQTGLEEFNADAHYKERLALILESMDQDSDLSDFGRLTQHNILVRAASNRLLAEDLIHRHPQILEQEIRQPIIIAGLPRSGTTHMLNLISADQRLRHLPYWESIEPVPVAAEAGASREEDPRRKRCEETLLMQDAIMPYFKNMHEMTADHTHEEIELASMDFSCMLFENYAMVPKWRDYYLAHDQRPHYAYMKRILKVLQWQYPKERWILKSPQHMEQLVVLRDTFPDAAYVLPHRDPLAIVVSLATMLSYTGRMSRSVIRPKEFTRYWADRLERMLSAMVEQMDQLPDAQTVHVRFDDFMADDMSIMSKIYDVANMELDQTALASMSEYVQNHPRGRLGRVEYDLDTLGVDVSDLRKRYRFYTEKFGVREEY